MIRKKTVAFCALMTAFALTTGAAMAQDSRQDGKEPVAPKVRAYEKFPLRKATTTASTTKKIELRGMEERKSTSTEGSTTPAKKLELRKKLEAKFNPKAATSTASTTASSTRPLPLIGLKKPIGPGTSSSTASSTKPKPAKAPILKAKKNR